MNQTNGFHGVKKQRVNVVMICKAGDAIVVCMYTNNDSKIVATVVVVVVCDCRLTMLKKTCRN